jgi:hypothetical protein
MKKRILGTIFIVITLGLLIIQPAVYAEGEITETRIKEYRIPWGAGIDENNDGIIDGLDESQVEYGNVTANYSHSLVNDWFKDWTIPGTTTLDKPRDGVQVAGFYEELWDIESSKNMSVSPTTICYDKELGLPNFGSYEIVTDVLNVVTFYTSIPAGVIMTGAQEIWYRSPLAWDNDTYSFISGNLPNHYLNIYDEDNNLVYAQNPPANYGLAKDDSVDGTDYYRVYYRLRMPFDSDTKYRFEEYVKTIDDNPINSVKLFMARAQDIGQNELTDTYIFRNSTAARKIPVECSYGFLFTMGKGIAGTENVIFSGNASGGANPTIDLPWTEYGTIDDVGSITFIFPLRTTKPIDIRISGLVDCEGGTGTNAFGPIDFNGLTGTAILTFNINDPGIAHKNRYRIQIEILNFATASGDAMTYMMYPGDQWHILTAQNSIDGEQIYIDYAAYFELVENPTPEETENSGVNEIAFLIGIGLLLTGIVFLSYIFPPATHVAILVGTKIIGTAMAVAGVGLTIFSFTGQSLEKFPEWFKQNLLRGAKQVWDGISRIVGGILDIVIKVIETVVNAGEWVLRNAGAILAAILDIIYFITAFIVWWLTAKFLGIMTAIRKGEIDQAARQIVRVEGSLRKRTRQIRRPIKKTRKGAARIVKR